jgi:hypothetical protein
MRICFLAAVLILGIFAAVSFSAEPEGQSAQGTVIVAEESTEVALQPLYVPKEEKASAEGPPLPLHTIEGSGGAILTPMAYLVNPPKKGDWFGLPAVGFSNVMMGHKNLQAFTVTENLFGRIEFGYALNRFDLGSLKGDVKDATGVDIGTDVWMHNFNLRGLLVEENSFGTQWIPAVTAGIHFKVNDGISDINHKLGGALDSLGYDQPWGIDYTLTASKTIAETWTLNRPLIVTGGLRNSKASNLGYLGFGNECKTTFEGSVFYLPTDWLLVGYEFRQKGNQYSHLPGLIGKEDDWHAIDVTWLINKNTTLAAGWGAFGNMINSTENCAWWLQLKYEF